MTNQTTKTRDSFIFYRSFFQSTRKLSAQDKAEIFDAICSYALDGEEIEMGIVPEAIFTIIKPNLDANRRKWANGCKDKKKSEDIEADEEQTISKTEAKQKQTISKPEGNVNVNVNLNENLNLKSKSECKSEIIELVKGLQFILEAKLNKKINTNSWKEPIRLLVEKDLAQRPNAIEDVKRAIQEVGNRFGEQYFPVIQSGGSLREKFSKIENAMRKPQTKGESTIANIMEDF
jgi:hypothetical protein